jgi:biotin transport system permease protein
MQALYLERRSWLHAVPAFAKLLLLATIGTALFMTANASFLLLAAGGSAVMILSMGPLGAGARRLARLAALAALLVGVFHAVAGAPAAGISNASRVFAMSMLGMAMTLSTRHSELLDAFERLLSPLAKVGVSIDRVSFQLALMMRFTEHFFVQWKRLDDAHRLRTGVPGRIRILAPLIIQMLLAARRVGDAVHLRW